MTNLADQPRGRVFTSRYQSSALIAASGAAPLRITLGPPRFRLGYELAGSFPSLAPRKRHFHLAGDAFREQYLADLDRRLGPDGGGRGKMSGGFVSGSAILVRNLEGFSDG
jgi:hypothetical protein